MKSVRLIILSTLVSFSMSVSANEDEGFLCEDLDPEFCQGEDDFVLYKEYASDFYEFLEGKSKQVNHGNKPWVWRWVRALSCDHSLKNDSYFCSMKVWQTSSYKDLKLTGDDARTMYYLLPGELALNPERGRLQKQVPWVECSEPTGSTDRWACVLKSL